MLNHPGIRAERLHRHDWLWHARIMAQTAQPKVDRFVIAATVDRLIYGDENTFQPADARSLLDALPKRRMPWFEIGMAGKMSGGSRRGYAAGIGDVRVKDERDRQIEYSSSAGHYTRIGQWKLLWYGKRLRQFVEIEQVMADFTDEGRGARISYTKDGTPIGMDIQINRSLSILWSSFVIVVPAWKPWKTPA
jgi:hypothetical protein